MRGKEAIWLLCLAYILLNVADAFTTHFALTAFPHFHEANPLLAHLFSECGMAKSLTLKVFLTSLPALFLAVAGTFPQTQERFERASFFGLLAGVVVMVALVMWNTSLLLMHGW